MTHDEIMKQYDPLIKAEVGKYYNAHIPKIVLETEAKIIARKALESYDPERGNVGAYLKQSLMKLNRVVNQASPVYIPERRLGMLNTYEKTWDEMYDKLKREPSDVEMADKLSVSMGDIRKLNQETKRKLISYGSIQEDSLIRNMHDDEALINFTFNKITDKEEKDVMGYSLGVHGYENLKTDQEIADKIGVSPTKVRNIKDKIILKLREYE